MDEKKGIGNLNTSVGNGIERAVFAPAFDLITQFSNRIQNYFKAQFNKSLRDNKGANRSSSLIFEREIDSFWKLNLEKQLRAWKDNPIWDAQKPEIKVTVPKGSLCNLNVKFEVGLPPDAIYDIVIDPGNKRVFKNIKEVISRKVLLDEGSRQVVEVEQAALWKFLWWSGVISVHVFVDQDRKDYSVRFKQGKEGFMKRFEGCWKVEPLFIDEELCSPLRPRTLSEYDCCSSSRGRVGSVVTLEQLVQPALVPPPPISWYLRGITARTTEMLVTDLIAEAERIKSVADDFDSLDPVEGCITDIDFGDPIKQRWRRRRQVRRRVVSPDS